MRCRSNNISSLGARLFRSALVVVICLLVPCGSSAKILPAFFCPGLLPQREAISIYRRPMDGKPISRWGSTLTRTYRSPSSVCSRYGGWSTRVTDIYTEFPRSPANANTKWLDLRYLTGSCILTNNDTCASRLGGLHCLELRSVIMWRSLSAE